jgi:putative hemolysin
VGLVSVKDVWAAAVGDDPAAAAGAAALERLARPPLYVPESLRALRLLERFRHRPASGPGAGPPPAEVAVVIGEHGGTEGLITLTDLLEAIVGDLPAAGATVPDGIVRRADGSWLVDGGFDADDLRERLGVGPGPEAGREEYHTVGGFVMQRLGAVPAPGDRFDWEGHRFEVVDMDGRRVDKVLVTPAPPPAPAGDGPPPPRSGAA